MVYSVPPVRRDPLIIGGGPAGTAAAISLARAGCRPVLVERTTGPTDKVCGDFLSVDAIQHVRSLGVDPLALGAAAIQRVRLISGEHIAETVLPFPALGLSRRTLDAALLHHADNAGAVLHTGQTVRHLTHVPLTSDPATHTWGPSGVRNGVVGDGPTRPTRNQWTAQISDNTQLTAETVFLATGKHDLRDLPRRRSERGAIGMKMYFALAPGPAKTLEGAIELTLFPGGYAGMQPVENGQAALCIAIQRRAFQRYGGGWPGLVSAIEQRSRRFAAMLTGARALLPRPLAIAGIPYGYQARMVEPDGLFRLGDQAAVIPSLTGDGMAIALHTGKTAAGAWLAGADSEAYRHALTRTLASQMRLAGALHHACMSAPVQSSLVRAAALFPGLLRLAACHTRLPSEPELVRYPNPA
jgi:flavin-dependent dehydrogenase